MRKKILLVTCTHGDEPIGKLAIEKLLKNRLLPGNFNSVVANPMAFAKNRRFIDIDLNRSAPGKKFSKKYEVRRAYELVNLFKNFDYVVDLHQTHANDRIVIIIPKLTKESLALALAFDIKDILIWPPSSPKKKTGPLVQYFRYGLEIESGTKTTLNKTLKKLVKVLTRFLINGWRTTTTDSKILRKLADQRCFYLVYDQIKPEEVREKKLKDFKTFKNNREQFIPLLFGKYQHLLGYKMRKVDNEWILSKLKLIKKLFINNR